MAAVDSRAWSSAAPPTRCCGTRPAPFCSYGSARRLESHSDISHAGRSGEMTERERIHEVEIQHPKTVDELMATTRPLREVALPEAAPQSVTHTLVVMPVDRVRWAAVLTGLVVALVTVALLSV